VPPQQAPALRASEAGSLVIAPDRLLRLAHESDLSMWTFYRMTERGSDPRLTTVLRLCRGLGVTASELLGDLPLPVQARPRLVRDTGREV
jgi:hypothetical protein